MDLHTPGCVFNYSIARLVHISELDPPLEVYLCRCSETAEAGDPNGFEDVQKGGKKKRKKNKKKAAKDVELEPDSVTASSTPKWWTLETAGSVALSGLMKPRTEAGKESALNSCILNSSAWSLCAIDRDMSGKVCLCSALVELLGICFLGHGG